MKIAFAGTPEFASLALEALHAAGHEIALVLTQPDRPAGRGMKLQASAVKMAAQRHALRLEQPRSLRLDGKFPEDAVAAQAALHEAAPDLMVVAAYGLILPAWTLALPRLGCLNIHGSLLPRWRGAAPIHRAIEAGDAVTGITIMQMDEGLDTGDMLLIESTSLSDQDSTSSLHLRLAAMGARLIVKAVDLAGRGELKPLAQPEAGVSYAHKIAKAEAALDWTQPAAALERRIRAFDPFPGCTTQWGGQTLKVWRARVHGEPGLATETASPGQFLPAGESRLIVACGEQALELLEVQAAGGRRLPVSEFLHRQGVQQG